MSCVCIFLNSFENYTSNFRPYLRHKISCSFSPSPSTHLLLPSNSYPWLPMVVSFFLTHLLFEMTSPIIFLFLHSTATKFQEEKDSIDEEDPRPTSSNGATSLCVEKHPRKAKTVKVCRRTLCVSRNGF